MIFLNKVKATVTGYEMTVNDTKGNQITVNAPNIELLYVRASNVRAW